MGEVAGERIARSLDRAAETGTPFLLITATGGARMQEGMVSLVQMAAVASSVTRLKQAGQPFIAVLTDPTTGGVYASYASLADFTFAEPGALIGFAGPRVFEMLTGHPRPRGTQSAEVLYEHGWIDAITDRTRLQGDLATLLRFNHHPRKKKGHGRSDPERALSNPRRDAWATVQMARDANRPTAQFYLQGMLTEFVELHGDRQSGDDPAVICGIGDLAGHTVFVVALERGSESDRERRRNGQARADGYRKALRVMRLAGQLRIPLLTLIDTPGAWLDAETDANGLAPAIAACLAAMAALPVPTIAAVIGEGGSGGALALGIADRILMQETAVYSVIAPEGAAAIIYRDPNLAPTAADRLKLTAADCHKLGVVDAIVPEPEGGASIDPNQAMRLLQDCIVHALIDVQQMSPGKLVEQRDLKFRKMGQRTIHVRRPWHTVKRFQAPLVQATSRLPQHLAGRLRRSGAIVIPGGELAGG